MKLYQIKDWDLHYENAKSRGIERCSFCVVPNKQDGLGYGRLLRMENGPALYGCFVAIVLMASKQKCTRQGYLTDTGKADGYPLTASDISVKTQMPVELVEAALAATSMKSVDWLSAVEVSDKYSSEGYQSDTKPIPESLEGRKEGKKEGTPWHFQPQRRLVTKRSLAGVEMS